MEHDVKLIAGKPERCPDCQRKDIRPSVFKGLRDNFMSMLGFRPYRCRACQRRFYRKMFPADEAGETGPASEE